ncbi:MAG: hypothetical protein A2498_03545 [Lentisphaerae bacterium RIFOXYC12_FULL_60_16]|nr:MAG: hypothetical protein A2498_03545 [Lentisphaerae bacterium RIFOXYC12_FULL_60_16]OGV83917.1 MAG: hypothetical protein A2340_11685 [Lentisphaerae bacterium RIFOXYB12_FULL_60_10]
MPAALQRALNVLLAMAVVLPPFLALQRGMLGASSKLQTVLWCSPALVLLLVVYYRLHPYLLFLGFVIPFTIPPFLGHRPIPLNMVFPLLVLAGGIARLCLGINPAPRTDRRVNLPMILISVLSLGWIAMDRPGMASMGAGMGGAWEAMLAVAGLSAYWGCLSLRGITPHWGRLVKTIWVVSTIVLIVVSIENIVKQLPLADIVSNWFWPTGWWFYGLALGYALKIWRKESRVLPLLPAYLLAAIIMINGLLSGFRSRILFAPLMAGSAFWVSGFRKQTILAIVAFSLLCLGVANTNLYERFPARAQRVLSVVRIETRTTRAVTIYGHGETGPKSLWRKELWSRAMRMIQEKPWLGHGYAFSSSLLLADLASATDLYEARMRGVATAGQFHNLALNVMYFNGIPAGLLFCYVWILSFIHLVQLASRHDGWKGTLFVGMLVYAVSETGQALMNGGGEDFLATCIWIGLVQAFRAADEHARTSTPPLEPAPIA